MGMSNNERELLKLVRSHKNPEKAVIVAVEIIIHALRESTG